MRSRRARTSLVITLLAGVSCASAPRRLWVADFAPAGDQEVVWLARGYDDDGEIQLYLARGKAEGGLRWLRQLPADADPVIVHGSSLGVVGDVVIVDLRQDWPAQQRDEVSGVHAFSLADGTPRWRDLSGSRGREDERLHHEGSYGDEHQRLEVTALQPPAVGTRVRAYDANGVQWTSMLDSSVSISGAALLTDRYLVFSDEVADSRRWHVLDRRSGADALTVMQEPPYGFECASPRVVYLEQREGIGRIDLRTLEYHQVVSFPLDLPPTRGEWNYTGCAVLEDDGVVLEIGNPVASGLIRLHPQTGEITYALDTEGFHVTWFPSPAPSMLAASGFGDEMDMVGVIDLEQGRLLSQHAVASWRGWHSVVVDGRSWVSNRQRIGVVDPVSGAVAGTQRLGRRWDNDSGRVVGTSLWLPSDRKERPHRLSVRVVSADRARRSGARALTRAMSPRQVRPPMTPLLCRLKPTRCVQGDGLGFTREPLPKVDPTAPMPPWELRPMHRAARRYAGALPHADTALLGWSIVEDDRPLRNHNALLLVEHRKDKRYSVVTLYRHAVNESWNISNSFHSSHRAVVTYDHRPTVAEVEQLCSANGWQLEGESQGFAVLAGATRVDTWVQWLGGAPSRSIVVTPGAAAASDAAWDPVRRGGSGG